MLDHAQVVGNEQIGQAKLGLQVLEDIQHLRLDGNIQRRNRLIADDELGAQGQGAGNANALALAAGKFVRVAAGMVIFQTHFSQGLDRHLKALARGANAVDLQAFHHRFADRHARIERGVRVLEDDLHVAAHGLQLAPLAA